MDIDNNRIQEREVDAFVEIGKISIKLLLDAIKDENIYIRYKAAKALDRLGAVDLLIKSLKDNSSFVRANAAEALGILQNSKAVDSLIDALSDRYQIVRIKAIEALKNIGDEKALEPLLELHERFECSFNIDSSSHPLYSLYESDPFSYNHKNIQNEYEILKNAISVLQDFDK